MDRAALKVEAQRLINEAINIAPTIVKFEKDRNYGNVTDEGFDAQAAQRWDLEASSVLIKLAESKIPAFARLNGKYYEFQAESKNLHSNAIFIHQISQLLKTAIELLDSVLAKESSYADAENSPKSSDKTFSSRSLNVPEKVTIPWLLRHVPIMLWITFAGIVFAAYSFGVKTSHISLISELYGLEKHNPIKGGISQYSPEYWPPLTQEEVSVLEVQMKRVNPDSITIGCASDNCSDLAKDFVYIFRKLGWKVRRQNESTWIGEETNIIMFPNNEAIRRIKSIVEENTKMKVTIANEKSPDMGIFIGHRHVKI